MRLVDADKLAEAVEFIAYLLANVPTVDPVKHGQWIKEKDTGADMLKCSQCECRIVLDWYKIAVGTEGYKYCPYCGAKMDEVEA